MTINITIEDSPDPATLAALHQGCFTPGWDAEAFAGLLKTAGTAALLAENEAGFALLRAVADEAEILTLAVAPFARRQGIARALVKAALAWAVKQGAKAVFLEVRASNEAALALYRSVGFTRSGRRKEYYRNAQGRFEDAVMMRKDTLD